jgi:hypothetical protein
VSTMARALSRPRGEERAITDMPSFVNYRARRLEP